VISLILVSLSVKSAILMSSFGSDLVQPEVSDTHNKDANNNFRAVVSPFVVFSFYHN